MHFDSLYIFNLLNSIFNLNVYIFFSLAVSDMLFCSVTLHRFYIFFSLAVSDMLFCSVTLSGAYFPEDQMIYRSKNLHLYFTLYGSCIQNILIKTSTWFTVIMAVSRYFAVCYPMKVGIIIITLYIFILILENSICMRSSNMTSDMIKPPTHAGLGSRLG